MSRSSYPVVILDNGASHIKAGVAGASGSSTPRVFPNSWARSRVERRTYVADEIEDAKDLSGLSYRTPFDRGYLLGWETEEPIWDRVFAQLSIEPRESSLFLTEPYNNPPSLQEATDQMVFEHWGFHSYYRTTPAQIVAQSPGVLFIDAVQEGNNFRSNPQCVLVVDSGYSFTHVVPFIDGEPVHHAVRRIDVGGKLLTNHLKTLISFRQWDMMDQTHVVNEVKEKTCFASKDFGGDLKLCQSAPDANHLRQEYVLPDFTSADRMHGYVKRGPGARFDVPPASSGHEDGEQLLVLGSERFSVPEILFNPSDIGLQQAGLAETIADSIQSLPFEIQGLFWSNIGLMGGNCAFPGFPQRLKVELQALSPVDVKPGIHIAKVPWSTPYAAISRLFDTKEKQRSARRNFERVAVTKELYDEEGSSGLARKRSEAAAWESRWAG